MHPIAVGACGWSYKEWVGPFYPRGAPPGEFLSRYAEHFSVVEVDSSFYHTPSARTVDGWRGKTPAGFGFSLKVPRAITHEKVLVDCAGDVAEFTAAARRLGEKLRCCLLQFGFFNRAVFSTVKKFLERLDPFLAGWPSDVPVAVEVRNQTWLGSALSNCLRSHHAALVLTDQAWMPTPEEVIERDDPVTGPLAYVRLLGDRAEMETLRPSFDHVVRDRAQELEADARAIARLAGRVPVVVFVNNHFAGYAPGTIRQLQTALGIEEGAKVAQGAAAKTWFFGRSGEPS